MNPTPPDLQSLWDYDDPAGTERRLRKLLDGDALPDAFRLELMTQVARARGLQGDFDDANRILDEVEASLTEEMSRARVRLWLERGRALNSSGRKDAARPLFDRAWDEGRRTGCDGLAVDAAHMCAIVAPDDTATLAWNQAALELAERSDDPDARRWCGSLWNNIGWTHHERERYDAALDAFERALRHREDAGRESDVRVARWCVGRCLRSLGRLEDALAVQRELHAHDDGAGGGDGFVHEEMGECLLALGRDEEARPHFRTAHARLSENTWLAESAPERLERLRRLSESTRGTLPGEGYTRTR